MMKISATVFLFLNTIILLSFTKALVLGQQSQVKETTEIIYQCPMKCESDKVYEKPGICPVCKMNLELVSNAKHQNSDSETKKPKSPRTLATESIGNNHVQIEYGSPSVRGRVIWNGLVAYGQVWVTGAHTATWIEFTDDVKINEQIIAKGRYGFFTIPDKEVWTIILSHDWDMHLADEYDPGNDVIRLHIKPEQTKIITEALNYEVKSIGHNRGQIVMSWEYLALKFDFENRNQ